MKKKVVSIVLGALTCLASHAATQNTAPSDPVEKIFTDIYENNKWFSRETASGHGSEIGVTQPIRPKISALIKLLNINSIADAPCGDLNWMKMVDLGSCRYIGIDIVQAIIDQNVKLYANPLRSFKHLNVIDEPIETVDLILCRDLLAHLTYEEIYKVLRNFKASGSKYLLVTTNTKVKENYDIQEAGGWRLLNLELPPFNFPKAFALIEEDVPYECERGKHLGLWRLDDILND